MRKMNKFLAVLLLILSSSFAAHAQKVALKTNLLYDATTTINMGLEFGLSQKWTLDISGNYNPWTFDNNQKWKHWAVQPEFRLWTCEKFNGHFFGFHLHGGQYNVGNINADFKFLNNDFRILKDHRIEGWFAGAGIAYGYAWVLGKHWNLEAEIGFGYAYTRYDKYDCVTCGEKRGRAVHNYVGPTKAALSLVYVF